LKDLHDKLFQEDLIHLLKELIEAQKNQLTVNVPEIKIPEIKIPKIDTPEVEVDLKVLADELRATLNDLKPKDEVKVLNIKEAQKDEVSIKNLKTIEGLLKKLLEKDTHITLKQDKQKIEVKMPTLTSPKDYIPVRLTDGIKFYNAISHAISSAGISQEAQDKLEKLEFEDGKLKITATNYSFYASAEDANYDYVGKTDKDGNWYIMRINKTTGVADYAVGASGMVTNWTNKASQSYDLYENRF